MVHHLHFQAKISFSFYYFVFIGPGPASESQLTLPPLQPSAAPRNLEGQTVWVSGEEGDRVAVQLTWDEMDISTLNGPLTKYAIYSRDSTIESSKYNTYYEPNVTSTSTIFYVQQDQLQHR